MDEIHRLKREIEHRDYIIKDLHRKMDQQVPSADVMALSAEINATRAQLHLCINELNATRRVLHATQQDLTATKGELHETQRQLIARNFENSKNMSELIQTIEMLKANTELLKRIVPGPSYTSV
jgi:chromosome segregation ATPase